LTALRKVTTAVPLKRGKNSGIAVYVPKDTILKELAVVLGYRFGGPRFDSQALPDFPTKKKKGKQVVGLERGSLSLVSTTEELLDRKVAAPV
jgi:hypothetical protein